MACPGDVCVTAVTVAVVNDREQTVETEKCTADQQGDTGNDGQWCLQLLGSDEAAPRRMDDGISRSGDGAHCDPENVCCDASPAGVAANRSHRRVFAVLRSRLHDAAGPDRLHDGSVPRVGAGGMALAGAIRR